MARADLVLRVPCSWPVSVACACLLAVGAGCEDEGPSLLVDLKTDLLPGVEFAAVQTTFGGGAPIEVAALVGDDFFAGRRVAEREVSPGETVLVVSLLGADRLVVAERRFRVLVTDTRGITAVLTRDCRTIPCAGAQTCFAGRCVPDDCVVPTDESCPPAECTTLAACPPMATCASPRCEDGVCFYVDTGTCGDGMFCAAESSCLPLPAPILDGSVPDAPPAGLFPLESFDAMPNAGGLEGEIRIVYELPRDIGTAMRLEVRRAAGDAPPADCATGDLVATVVDFTSAPAIVDRVPDRWNRTHGYRACFFDASGGALTGPTMTATAVRYANPGPGCSHPPCDLVGSTVAATRLERAASVIAGTGSSGGDAILTDLDGDDDLDIVIGTTGANIVQIARGDGVFGAPIMLGSPAETAAVVAGDFDNDGDKDVVFANISGPSVIRRGRGGGSLDGGIAIYPQTFSAMHDVAAADLNGDGYLDLVFATYEDLDRIYLGDGTGGFAYHSSIEPASLTTCVNCIEMADMNHDFRTDIVLGYNGGTKRLDLFLGVGDATFQPPFSVPFGTLTPIAVELADLNDDGHMDVVVGESSGGGIWTAYGDGGGMFTPLTEIPTSTSARCYGVAATDFDGDGDVDIAFSQDATGVIGFLRSNGDGTFAPQVALDGGAQHTTTNMEYGDIDRDGRMDLLVGIDTNSLVLLGR